MHLRLRTQEKGSAAFTRGSCLSPLVLTNGKIAWASLLARIRNRAAANGLWSSAPRVGSRDCHFPFVGSNLHLGAQPHIECIQYPDRALQRYAEVFVALIA